MSKFERRNIEMTPGHSTRGVAWQLRGRARALAWPWLILFSIAIFALPESELLAAKRHEISHVAFIWLKRPGNVADQQLLVRAAKRFRKIRGVVRVDAGAGMPVARPGIEQPFDVGMVIVFRDRVALDDYAKNPRHLAAMHEIFLPLAKRYVIYNFWND